MRNKITYGLSKCAFAPITEEAEDGTLTYGEVIKMPGATELSLDIEGDTNTIYADDGPWDSETANNGYSGSVKFKTLPDEFYTEILGETKDKNGVYVENANAKLKKLALMFQFKGDKNETRYVFYKCTVKRPSVASKTKEDKIEANDFEISIKADPRMSDGNVKAKCFSDSDAYATFFDKVYEPVAASSGSSTSSSSGSETSGS